jgi:Coenzyme PQQ synthesis protein D (PqqD)
MPSEVRLPRGVLSSRAAVPDHVVYRSFVSETVILNLNTGKYHGVDPSGGFMLELLEKLDSVEEASAALAREYGLPAEQAAQDLCDFCLELEQRGLIELRGLDGA